MVRHLQGHSRLHGQHRRARASRSRGSGGLGRPAQARIQRSDLAGTAKLVVNTMIQKYGHDEGIQYLVDLDKNIQVYTKSGSGPSKNVGIGECVIGIGTLEDGSAKQLKKSGQEHWIYIGDTPIAREYDGMIVYHIPETSKVEISQQNTLSVPRGGEFRLTLSDGTRVHLNSLSELKYPVSFKGMNERTVELKGEAFFEIAKDSLHPFKVETQGILIQQFGTAFNVKSRVKGKVEVALVQGSIGIYTQSQKLHKLSPGQLAIWDASTDLLSVENKDLLLNTAWHSNRFIFYDESLGSLMEELALWYNVDVDFLDKSLKELHFTGSLYRYDDIAVILNAIEETVNVDFKISGLRIKIDRKNK